VHREGERERERERDKVSPDDVEVHWIVPVRLCLPVTSCVLVLHLLVNLACVFMSEEVRIDVIA
jgi:hypothetical protein